MNNYAINQSYNFLVALAYMLICKIQISDNKIISQHKLTKKEKDDLYKLGVNDI
jgi:hypothetical protein